MLLLSKSISQLLLPPGGLILMALLGLVFWKKSFGRLLVGLALLLFWLLSIEPVRDLLTSSLEDQYPALNIEKIDNKHAVIVLLGGGIQQNSLDYHGKDTLRRFAMMRTLYAAKIAANTGFDVYPTGGSPLNPDSATESSVMKKWLIWFGIPQIRIHEENKAHTTWENALFTKQMIQKKGIHNIILVTSAWHMPRAVWCFEQHGFNVTPAPTDYLTKREAYDLRSFLPRWDVFSDSGHALHEYLGTLWYSFKT